MAFIGFIGLGIWGVKGLGLRDSQKRFIGLGIWCVKGLGFRDSQGHQSKGPNLRP